MARTYLNSKMESWLIANYAKKTNEEIAEHLTLMVREENEQQIKRLYAALENISTPSLRQRIYREIDWRKSFTSLTPLYIRQVANRLNCPKKDFVHISRNNQLKARRTNVLKWLSIAQEVTDFAPWLKSFHVRETRVCFARTEKVVRSVRNAVDYFNRYEGLKRGISLSTDHVQEEGLMRIIAIPLTKKNK